MNHAKEAVALLFSGGLDTTIEVSRRLEEYDRVYLLTFDNGYCINVRGALARVKELQERFGAERVKHDLVNIKPWMQTLLVEARRQRPEIRSPLVFDLACKTAALTALVCFARANKVVEISDGSAIEQTQIFLQHPDFATHIEPWLAKHGLRLKPPVHFDETREAKLEMLEAWNFRSGPHMLEKAFITSQLLHQPFCLRGLITYFFTSPLRHLSFVRKRALTLTQAKELFDLLIPAADELIRSQQQAGGGPVTVCNERICDYCSDSPDSG